MYEMNSDTESWLWCSLYGQILVLYTSLYVQLRSRKPVQPVKKQNWEDKAFIHMCHHNRKNKKGWNKMDHIFKRILLNENFDFFNKILLEHVP